jgi:hypothetical protein
MADYCTHRDLKDIYPHLDEFDSKEAVYNWVALATNVYSSQDSGLTTCLFNNGKNLSSYQLTSTSATPDTTITSAITSLDSTTVSLTAVTNIAAGTIIQIGTEKMFVVSIATLDATVIRGFFGTTRATALNSASVSLVGLAFDGENEWYYDSVSDVVIFYSSSDPNDLLMESGDDFATIIARYITNASYYLDSALNSVLPREQFKNADGTYDYVIIRLASLLAVYFMIIADDPENPKATALKTEVDETIDGLVNGRIKLAKDVTSDASEGVLREVTHTSGKMLPVDTRGAYTGVYDKIKIKITTAGVLGTGKFTTSIKSSSGLKTTDLTPLAITGDYQELTGGLEVRFAADSTDTTSWQAAVNDEWELEVYGINEEVDRGRPKTVRACR